MRELSLFTGVGGGVLGSKILGWRTIGYVEKEEYCQKIIKQRIEDGIFDDAPIFSNIRHFIDEGFADTYNGFVDVVSAGFPCQPFSVSGKRVGEKDERNMWPETVECVRRIQPRFVFLENVPGLLSSGYFGRILGDLAESGYDAEWTVLGADEVGANHRRKRLWILAYTRHGCSWGKKCGENETNLWTQNKPSRCGETLGHSNAKRLQGINEEKYFSGKSEIPPRRCNWWSAEPLMGRMAYGVANRVDRIKAIGNGQVPIQMAYAFSKLFERINLWGPAK